MNNNYSAPSSTLVNHQEGVRSLEDAMAGNYEFSALDTISEAWNNIKGIKRYVIGTGLLMYVAMGIIIGIMSVVGGVSMDPSDPAAQPSGLMMLVMQIAIMAIVMPFGGGLFIICLKHLQGRPVAFGDVFAAFAKTGPFLVAFILIMLMIGVGMILLVIPAIYLSYCYFMVLPLMLDRDLGPWQAMEASRKASTKSWFRIFGMYLLLMLIMFISMIPLGIGMIWSMPLMVMSFAVMYQKMFGIASY